MHFIETPVFAQRRQALLSEDEQYRLLQSVLLKRPVQGVVLQGTGGLRKIRWHQKGGGKRGGLRIIYYYHPRRELFFLLFMYAKNEQEDLSATQRRLLARVVKEEFK